MERRNRPGSEVEPDTQQAGIASLAGFNGGNGDNTNKLLREDPAASIRAKIADRERQLAEQRARREEARATKDSAKVARDADLVEAKVDGDAAAKARLEATTASLRQAEQEETDLDTIIQRLEAKIADLNRELKAAERKKITDEMCALGVKRVTRAPEIDECIQRAVALIAETQRDAAEMHNLAAGIGLTGSHFDANDSLAGFLHIALSRVLPRDFSCRSDLAAHYSRAFVTIERERLGGHLEREGIPLPKEDPKEATPGT